MATDGEWLSNFSSASSIAMTAEVVKTDDKFNKSFLKNKLDDFDEWFDQIHPKASMRRLPTDDAMEQPVIQDNDLYASDDESVSKKKTNEKLCQKEYQGEYKGVLEALVKAPVLSAEAKAKALRAKTNAAMKKRKAKLERQKRKDVTKQKLNGILGESEDDDRLEELMSRSAPQRTMRRRTSIGSHDSRSSRTSRGASSLPEFIHQGCGDDGDSSSQISRLSTMSSPTGKHGAGGKRKGRRQATLDAISSHSRDSATQCSRKTSVSQSRDRQLLSPDTQKASLPEFFKKHNKASDKKKNTSDDADTASQVSRGSQRSSASARRRRKASKGKTGPETPKKETASAASSHTRRGGKRTGASNADESPSNISLDQEESNQATNGTISESPSPTGERRSRTTTRRSIVGGSNRSASRTRSRSASRRNSRASSAYIKAALDEAMLVHSNDKDEEEDTSTSVSAASRSPRIRRNHSTGGLAHHITKRKRTTSMVSPRGTTINATNNFVVKF